MQKRKILAFLTLTAYGSKCHVWDPAPKIRHLIFVRFGMQESLKKLWI